MIGAGSVVKIDQGIYELAEAIDFQVLAAAARPISSHSASVAMTAR